MSQIYSPEHVIPLTDAISRVQAWQNQQQLLANPTTPPDPNLPVLNINGFTMRFSELFNMCLSIYNSNCTQNGQPPIDQYIPTNENLSLTFDAIRFYLGIRPTANPQQPLPQEACLVCVPVSGFSYEEGTQVPGAGGIDNISLPSSSTYNNTMGAIYDFSFPCPMTCATNDIFPKSCS